MVFFNEGQPGRTAWNLLAESQYGNPNNVVMAGAHLDSVQNGPGINDNGSGSAALLETAIQMSKVKTNAKVRFVWWEAEESGLLGSDHHVMLTLAFDTSAVNGVRAPGKSHGRVPPRGSPS